MEYLSLRSINEKTNHMSIGISDINVKNMTGIGYMVILGISPILFLNGKRGQLENL